MLARSLVCSFLGLLASCAPRTAETLLGDRPVSSGEVLSRIAAGRASATVITGRGEATIESPEGSGSAFFRFGLMKPDSLLVRIQGPFGIDVGSLLFSPGTTLYYDAMQNLLIAGEKTMTRVQTFFPFSVDRAAVMNLFAGEIPAPGDTSALSPARDGNDIILTSRQGGAVTTWRVEPEEWVITQMTIVDSSGSVLLEAEASEFHSVGESRLPRRIRFEAPSQERFLSLYFTSQSVDTDPPPFRLTVPPSARRVER